MKLLTRQGQSTGEYAILFAIVLGGVVAMQSFVRSRISGAIQGEAVAYETVLGHGTTSITRSAVSSSDSTADMIAADVGVFETGSVGETTIGE